MPDDSSNHRMIQTPKPQHMAYHSTKILFFGFKGWQQQRIGYWWPPKHKLPVGEIPVHCKYPDWCSTFVCISYHSFCCRKGVESSDWNIEVKKHIYSHLSMVVPRIVTRKLGIVNCRRTDSTDGDRHIEAEKDGNQQPEENSHEERLERCQRFPKKSLQKSPEQSPFLL